MTLTGCERGEGGGVRAVSIPDPNQQPSNGDMLLGVVRRKAGPDIADDKPVGGDVVEWVVGRSHRRAAALPRGRQGGGGRGGRGF